MNWFFSLVRIVGASFPVASSILQLQAELSSNETQKRLQALEDPISALHPDVRDVSRTIYDLIRQTDVARVDLSDEMYGRYERALAVLEARGFIRGGHSTSQRFFGGLWVTDPAYLVYMCGLYEDPSKMDHLFTRIEEAGPRVGIKGEDLATELGLPIPAIRAVFEIFEDRGLGILSKESGTANYYSRF